MRGIFRRLPGCSGRNPDFCLNGAYPRFKGAGTPIGDHLQMITGSSEEAPTTPDQLGPNELRVQLVAPGSAVWLKPETMVTVHLEPARTERSVGPTPSLGPSRHSHRCHAMHSLPTHEVPHH